MGEASRRKKRSNKFLLDHPFCCYCGGSEPATTIDHVPSRQMFLLRERPRGLEVPACTECNRNTGGHEQVAAMMARMYPDPKRGLELEEATKIMKAVGRWNPLLLPELFPSWRQQYDFDKSKQRLPPKTHALNASGDLLNKSMQIFGAKVICALHYEKTGKVIPSEGGIAVRWFSNYERFTDEFPDDVIKLFSEYETISQGKKNVGEQFGYSWRIVEDADVAAYFAYFRRSFSIIGFAYHDRSRMPDADNMQIHTPGFARCN